MPCAAPLTTATRPSKSFHRRLSLLERISLPPADDRQRRLDAGADIDLLPELPQRAAEGADRDRRIDRLGDRPHMADADQLALGLAAAAGEHDAVDARGRRRCMSLSLTPSGTRTAVQVGEAMASLLAQSDSPIALMPARQALAVRAWRCQTCSGPSVEIVVERRVEAVDLGDRGGEGEGLVLAPGILPVEQAQHRGARAPSGSPSCASRRGR